MLKSLKDKIADSQFAHRISVVTDNSPRIPGVFLAVVLMLFACAAPVYGWKVKRDRDQWWRSEIARHSSAVRGVVAQGSAEALATDEDIIKAIGATDADLNKAKSDLANANTPVEGCAPVPARCIGLR